MTRFSSMSSFLHRLVHRLVHRRSALPGITRRLVLTALLLAGLPAGAQEAGQETADAANVPSMQAARAETPPVLDGDVLGEDAWSVAEPATGLVQTRPREGDPASERTEVYVLFDDETLYLGVVCHDREPGGIIVAGSRRDAPLDDTDSFRVLLDTFADDRTAYVFGTNPAGIQYDGQVTRDALGENAFVGSFNLDWDGAWQVATRTFEGEDGAGGWSAELAIPFRTLRFPAGSPQTWGINFQRNIRRHKEVSFWAPIGRQFDLTKVSLAGRVEGVEPPPQRVVQVTPYVLVEGERGPGIDGTEDDVDAGVDAKIGLTPSLTLDLTYNTDFAQVEADVQQINFDRFNLFFPEKRPFFLENAGYFDVGVPAEIELFFSRRIGLGPNGEEVPILGGARLTGKVGRTSVGALVMRTDDVRGVQAENDFGVLRLSREIGERSSVGFLVTSREGEDGPDDEGQTYAVDGRWAVNEKLELRGFAALTETPDAVGDEHAFRLGGNWTTEKLVASLNYTEVGEGFSPEVGFLARRGYRKADGFALVRHRPKKNVWNIHELRPHIFFRSFWDFDGVQETGYLHVDNHIEWRGGEELHTGVNFTRERVKEPFEIVPGVVVPAGLYEHELVQFGLFSNRSAPISVGLGGLIGGFFGGDRTVLSPSLRFRRGEKLNGELVWSHNDIDLPGGDFETDLARLRLSYAFTPRLFVEGLVQYNTTVDQWSSNIRFGWRDDANSGLYVVYNDVRETGVGAEESQRRLIIKYSRLIDLFRK